MRMDCLLMFRNYSNVKDARRVIHLCLRHDKPLRKITIPEYSSHDIWMVDVIIHYGVLHIIIMVF